MECLQGLLDLEEGLSERAGALDAVISERGLSQNLSFGAARLDAIFSEGVPGAVAVLPLEGSEDASVAEAYILASGASLSFASDVEDLPFAEVLSLEEGEVLHGQWKRGRRLNGDELQVLSCDEPTLLKVRIHLFG